MVGRCIVCRCGRRGFKFMKGGFGQIFGGPMDESLGAVFNNYTILLLVQQRFSGPVILNPAKVARSGRK